MSKALQKPAGAFINRSDQTAPRRGNRFNMKMEIRKQAIDKIYKRRDRYDIPEYQREEVWGTAEKQLLIDTILRGWKLPKFYLQKTSASSYEVVDGQQRLSAIFEFLDGDLALAPATSALYGDAEYYGDLDIDVSDKFDDYEIDFDEIEEATDDEIQEFFKRLQGGFRLNSPERLNAVPGKLTSFCRALAQHDFFKNAVSFKNKRYAYFDVASKASAIEIEGLDAGMRIGDLEPLFRSQASFSSASKIGKRLKSALDFLSSALPSNSRALRLRSITQSIITLACALQDQGLTEGREKQFAAFIDKFFDDLTKQVEAGHAATDSDYLTFQRTVSANVKNGARTRHQVLMRKLFQFDPSFIEGFSAEAVSASGVDAGIKESQKQIITLVESINTVHSAKNGKDLFKATNKTVPAQHQLGEVIRDFDQYKKLVESMYFLFWEGPGSSLGDKPDSFKKVNTLRTELQHDVDHGGAKKYSQKKKASADAFMSLSGAASPEAAPPERFPIVQLTLLNEIRADLTNLLKKMQESA